MKTLEQELKLALISEEFQRLSALTTNSAVLQTNNYFGGDFPTEETMVRIREKGGKFLLCYKRRLSEENGIFVCDERECELEKNFAKSLLAHGIAAKEINNILKTDFSQDLRYVGKMDTYRTAFIFEKWHVELDQNFYLGICDFELECECESVGLLEELKNRLREESVEIRYSTPKSARFFDVLAKYNR